MTDHQPPPAGRLEELAERLRRRERLIELPSGRVFDGDHVNPDGPEAAAAILTLTAELAAAEESLRHSVELLSVLEPFAAIGADYPTGGLGADIQQRAPVLMRRIQAIDFYRAAKAVRKARAALDRRAES